MVAAVDCFCWLLLLIAGRLLVAAGILLAGRKLLEYFPDFDDWRLRQFCRRKSLWIFSGYWWEESGREFRLGEIDQLTVGSGSDKWECTGYLYPAMAQSYHVTSHVIMQAWCMCKFEYWANRVEPHSNALRNFPFPSFCAIPILQLSFIQPVILFLPSAARRLVNSVCSSLVKH